MYIYASDPEAAAAAAEYEHRQPTSSRMASAARRTATEPLDQPATEPLDQPATEPTEPTELLMHSPPTGLTSSPPRKRARVHVDLSTLCESAMSTNEDYFMFKDVNGVETRMRVVGGGTSGTFGTTRVICDDQNMCKYVVKFVRTNDYANTDGTCVKHFRIEANMLRVASDAGVAPTYHTFEVCGGGRHGVIVMDRMDMSLSQLLRSRNMNYVEITKLANMVYAVVRKMHDIGILHQDLHAGNVMVNLDKRSNEVNEVKIIDYGKAIRIDGVVPPFLRACDLAILYYGFARPRLNWKWGDESMCKLRFPLPPPAIRGGVSIPRAAVIAAVAHADEILFKDNARCPHNEKGDPVATRPDFIYEALSECKGFDTFVFESFDVIDGWGQYICVAQATPDIAERCQQIFEQIRNIELVRRLPLEP
jgi:hypothetical protein